jgi:hypothetical protein
MTILFDASVTKLSVSLAEPVEYRLGDLALNEYIGKPVRIVSRSEKQCIHCNRAIKKTFGQGYCFPCFKSLARCDMCIVRPERCHFHKGTCREPAWGEENCLIEHVVYLANTSGLKIGITRAHQKHTRWIDQGASAALELAIAPGRLESGLIEQALTEHYADKTNWRSLLTGKEQIIELAAHKEEIKRKFASVFERHKARITDDFTETTITYPVLSYLPKAKTANLDVTTEVSGVFSGIRGQYLMVGDVGINVRKYQGYLWTITTE